VKIRTQIALALFLLAIVPMSAIVFYSYISSVRAVEEAVKADAATLTAEIEQRRAEIRGDIQQRVERISQLRFPQATAEHAAMSDLYQSMAAELGDTAQLVRSFEFVPGAPPAGHQPPPPPPGVEPGTAEGRPHPPPAFGRPPPSRAEPQPTASPEPVAEDRSKAPIVIDMKELMKSVEGTIRRIDPQSIEGTDREELIEAARRGLEMAQRKAEEIESQVPAMLEVLPLQVETAEPNVELEEELFLAAGAAALEIADIEGVNDVRVLFEPELEVPVYEDGARVGEIRAEVEDAALLQRIFNLARRRPDEVPFALRPNGEFYAASDEDRATLEELDLSARFAEGAPKDPQILGNWIVVTTDRGTTGLTFGVARPIRESLTRIRKIAFRNLSFGAGLIGLAVLAVYPLSRRMTQNLTLVTEGAERLATGDFSARVPLQSKDEIGQLAAAFNDMAGELEENQRELLAGELLKAEYDRKSEELEEARRFQLSLLPKEIPTHPHFEIAATMKTATEVGGDYYDFGASEPGSLTLAIGDATGHGAMAGTMVTVVKSLFSAYTPAIGLPEFLEQAAATVRRMELGRMSMALTLAKLSVGRLTLSAAGMPPALIHRAVEGDVSEVILEGMPLGGLDYRYQEASIELSPGDTILLMSDGFPELPDPQGDTLGYERSAAHFKEAVHGRPSAVIDHLLGVAREWSGGAAPADDITFVVIRVREA